jgi:hypothetical protein
MVRSNRKRTRPSQFDLVNQFHEMRQGSQAPSGAVARDPGATSHLRALHDRVRTPTGLSVPWSPALIRRAAPTAKPTPQAAATPMANLGGDLLGRLMAAIRTKESGGNYNARGPSTRYGVARGAYQFLPSTYSGFARQVGVNPSDWSRASQDRVARHAMATYLRQFGNDPARAAVAWYAGPGRAANYRPGTMTAPQSAGGRRGNMPSIDAYARAILALMGR